MNGSCSLFNGRLVKPISVATTPAEYDARGYIIRAAGRSAPAVPKVTMPTDLQFEVHGEDGGPHFVRGEITNGMGTQFGQVGGARLVFVETLIARSNAYDDLRALVERAADADGLFEDATMVAQFVRDCRAALAKVSA